MSIDAMKQALEALEYCTALALTHAPKRDAAIAALGLAIEQAEKQEPVAWVKHLKEMVVFWQYDKDCPAKIMEELKRIELTAPPQRQPLTREEIDELFEDGLGFERAEVIVREIEHAHGIGGGE